MNLEAQRHRGCDSDEQRLMMNNTSNEYLLMTQMLSDANIASAWKHVKANKGSPGIDNMSIEEFDLFAKEHWQGIKTKLIEGNYQPLAVKRVCIPKPDGGERLLGIPAVATARCNRQDDPASDCPGD